jgi:flagellar basal-body rod protein FlgB
MLENKVTVLNMARAMAAHAATRQGLVAANVANADTPGYRPRDLPSFAETMRGRAADDLALRRTRPGHLPSRETAGAFRSVVVRGVTSPNGNSVSIEAEMMRAAEVRQAHDLALAIRSALSGAVRTALGRGR